MSLALVVLFEVLNVADFVTTWIGLRLGASEGNRLVARSPRLASLGKLAAMIVVLVGYQRFHGVLLVVLALVTISMAGTVTNNIRVCREWST